MALAAVATQEGETVRPAQDGVLQSLDLGPLDLELGSRLENVTLA